MLRIEDEGRNVAKCATSSAVSDLCAGVDDDDDDDARREALVVSVRRGSRATRAAGANLRRRGSRNMIVTSLKA